MVLQALYALGQSNTVAEVQSGFNYLVASQIPAGGWAIFPEPGNITTDAIVTALVLKTLVSFQSGYPGSLRTDAVATLESTVTINSPDIVKAHTDLALLQNDKSSVKGLKLLDSFTQAPDRSWSQDIYLTSLIIQAMTIVEDLGQGNDLQDIVPLADAELHEIISASLNKNRSDALRRGDLVQLASLDLTGTGVSSLSGLEGATNLTSLTIDVNASGYTSFAGGVHYAGIINDLRTLDGEGLNVTVNLSGPVDDSDDGVYITFAVQEDFDTGMQVVPSLKLKGINLFETGVDPVVTLGNIPLTVLSAVDIVVATGSQEVIVQVPSVLVGAYRVNLTNSIGRSDFESAITP